MKPIYSAEFIEQALTKVYTRGDRTIQSVADDLNIPFNRLDYWMKKTAKNKQTILTTIPTEKRPHDWTAEERLDALHKTHHLSGDALQAWCREHGLFVHHLMSWKAAFCVPPKEMSADKLEVRNLKEENAKLKREAIRKDRALAEAAALLILQKKFRTLWEDEEK